MARNHKHARVCLLLFEPVIDRTLASGREQKYQDSIERSPTDAGDVSKPLRGFIYFFPRFHINSAASYPWKKQWGYFSPLSTQYDSFNNFFIKRSSLSIPSIWNFYFLDGIRATVPSSIHQTVPCVVGRRLLHLPAGRGEEEGRVAGTPVEG